ncbi:MAG: type II toxin-antitoxin system VapC family toxin [Phycisphaerales bacterium]|nr:type II toxin-antitoxin system VapC family toxin [Phycisphaerales bacterium]
MNYLLDTSVCIDHLRRPDSPMHEWMRSQGPDSVRICSVVRTELLLGVHKSPTERNRNSVAAFLAIVTSIPFDDAAADVCAKIRADLERKGHVIGPYDLQIAAIAVLHGATLVTGNAKEFSRIPELQCLALGNLATDKMQP